MEKPTSLRKLSDIDDKLELWRGTKIRIMLEQEDYETDHFDYMLIQAPGDHGYMILVNITDGNYKEGAVFINKVEVASHTKVIVNTAKCEAVVYPVWDTVGKTYFTYIKEDDYLILKSKPNDSGNTIYVRLKRFDEKNFRLMSRGFHWINEYPYNR